MLLRLGAAVKLNMENRATSIQKAIISQIFLKQKLTTIVVPCSLQPIRKETNSDNLIYGESHCHNSAFSYLPLAQSKNSKTEQILETKI